MPFYKPFILSAGALILSGCASVMPLTDKITGEDLFQTNKPVYTLVNLHPDEKRMKLYSVNYQQDGLIPVCTKVNIVNVQNKRLTFAIDGTDKQYAFDKHRSSPDFAKYLSNYFGTECNSSKIKKLSTVDQQGIKKGIVTKGMTKEGVKYAIGFPPEHKTPDLNGNEWLYWKNRFNTFKVEFKNNKVSNIID
ncbi:MULTISPECIES: hypothetical protein [Aliivibrio]|uniref:Lipoprotein n=1 Tax=Aliivibrio finisterrensis TaxID=511998 RepID=A0A4Q5KUH7_9GAMM|nr:MULTISPECIES: hypothetical protein [Aliivibrio]MDD9178884.1 hypothetical protein [Aliivibrio sp. A6]RYU51731.1 hypothetical protein ERW57_08715 [Aliivibrio finisterrensis]RYU53205.1 hypothetical protein ERW56_08645 [Aliivibrio finisterrensis]RYU58663.1 hypothetical protein ERW50_08070 [Aliivibrio finisterrensis]RYU64838.1 hypothetical protein ERW53_08280 [Aliivibrio finisterrensis]